MGQLKVSKAEYEKIYNVDYQTKPIKVFISYASIDSETLALTLGVALEKFGVSTFLSKRNIRPSANWEKEIIKSLRECDVFLPILTTHYHDSEWADQETGMAFAHSKLIIPLRVDGNPYGFIGRIQAFDCSNKDTSGICTEIIDVLKRNERLSPLLNNYLFTLLEKVNSFESANEVIKKLSSYKVLTKEQVNWLIKISIKNHQVRNSAEGLKLLKSINNKRNRDIDPILKTVYTKLEDNFDTVVLSE